MKRYCKLYNELHTSPSRVQYKQKDFQLVSYNKHFYPAILSARLAQSVEHGTLNPGVVGSSPTLGALFAAFMFMLTEFLRQLPTSNKQPAEIAQLGER